MITTDGLLSKSNNFIIIDQNQAHLSFLPQRISANHKNSIVNKFERNMPKSLPHLMNHRINKTLQPYRVWL